MRPPSPALTPVLMVIFFMVVLLAHAAADVATVACFDAGPDGDVHGRFSWFTSTPTERPQAPGPTTWLPALTFVLMVIFCMVVSP
jgi:hypothetical protein